MGGYRGLSGRPARLPPSRETVRVLCECEKQVEFTLREEISMNKYPGMTGRGRASSREDAGRDGEIVVLYGRFSSTCGGAENMTRTQQGGTALVGDMTSHRRCKVENDYTLRFS